MKFFMLVSWALLFALPSHGAWAFSEDALLKLRETGSCPGCDLSGADLSRRDLSGADLSGADLNAANLSGANLSGANLSKSTLVATNLEKANLESSRVFGVSAWDLKLSGTHQNGLIVTPPGQPAVTTDNIEMAQFVYLILDNRKMHDAIDSLTEKVVLILGRFTPERKRILDGIRTALKSRNYTPIVFDFEKPGKRDITETVSLLANMSRFVIADISEAKSIPQELAQIVPNLPSVPVQPLLQSGLDEYSMFEHFKRYPWVQKTFRYKDLADVMSSFNDRVIGPAEKAARTLHSK